MMPSSDYNGKKGVTLTELSISVVVITMLIAGTFAGITILKSAKIRKNVNEFTSYMGAINQFQSQYEYLPGDFPDATNYWGGAAHDGNGNNNIDIKRVDLNFFEDLYVWEHLAKAKIIPGTYTGAVSGTRYTANVNAPNSESFTNGIFSFWSHNLTFVNEAVVYGTSGNALKLGSISGGWSNAGLMLAKDAYAIDIKIDDGLASSGMFYAAGERNKCTTFSSAADSADYVLSDLTNASCVLYYWQKKF